MGSCPSEELSWWVILVGSRPGGELSWWELSNGGLPSGSYPDTKCS